jgi:hypothetical protein
MRRCNWRTRSERCCHAMLSFKKSHKIKRRWPLSILLLQCRRLITLSSSRRLSRFRQNSTKSSSPSEGVSDAVSYFKNQKSKKFMIKYSYLSVIGDFNCSKSSTGAFDYIPRRSCAWFVFGSDAVFQSGGGLESRYQLRHGKGIALWSMGAIGHFPQHHRCNALLFAQGGR